MGKYDVDAHFWSGLLAHNKFNWQKGVRAISRGIGGVQYHSTVSGYKGWEKVAESAIRRKPKSLLLGGHSNGGFAITSIAEAVNPFGIECWLVCIDRTMKSCPDMRGNVVEAIDLHAGLRTLDKGPDFTGNYVYRPFLEETHIGIQNNPEVQRIAIEFGKRWKESR